MFGVLRLGLALLVVYAHLAGSPRYSHSWGIFAVFGFYIVSGYLMTLVLNTTYRFKAVPFFTNRILRLYPDYLLFAGLSLVAILLLPEAASYHLAFAVKTGVLDVIGNLFVVPFLFYEAPFRLIPPTWSIAVELGYYFLLWLFIARRPSIAMAVFVASVLFHGWSLYAGEPWPKRYFPFLPAALPFSIGALLFFGKNRVTRLGYGKLKGIGIAAVVLFFVNGVLCNVDGGTKSGLFDVFFYVNMICLAALIASLIVVRRFGIAINAAPIKRPARRFITVLDLLIGFGFWFERDQTEPMQIHRRQPIGADSFMGDVTTLEKWRKRNYR